MFSFMNALLSSTVDDIAERANNLMADAELLLTNNMVNEAITIYSEILNMRDNKKLAFAYQARSMAYLRRNSSGDLKLALVDAESACEHNSTETNELLKNNNNCKNRGNEDYPLYERHFNLAGSIIILIADIKQRIAANLNSPLISHGIHSFYSVNTKTGLTPRSKSAKTQTGKSSAVAPSINKTY